MLIWPHRSRKHILTHWVTSTNLNLYAAPPSSQCTVNPNITNMTNPTHKTIQYANTSKSTSTWINSALMMTLLSFMYYSIPAIKKAEYLYQDVDITILRNSYMRQNSISCPGRMESEEFSQPVRRITRKSRISFECHNSLFESSFLDDLYDDEELWIGRENVDGVDVLDFVNNIWKREQRFILWSSFGICFVMRTWEQK